MWLTPRSLPACSPECGDRTSSLPTSESLSSSATDLPTSRWKTCIPTICEKIINDESQPQRKFQSRRNSSLESSRYRRPTHLENSRKESSRHARPRSHCFPQLCSLMKCTVVHEIDSNTPAATDTHSNPLRSPSCDLHIAPSTTARQSAAIRIRCAHTRAALRFGVHSLRS